MNQILGKWSGESFKQSLPWIRCFAVFIPAVLAAGYECEFLLNARNANRKEALLLGEMEAVNHEREVQTGNASAKFKALEEAADLVLGGLLRDDQEEPDLTALEELGPEDSRSVQGDDSVRVKISSADLEYHILLPALNQQETNTPLMRCTWLSLKTTGKPFHTSALPLQIDLELAFPTAFPQPAVPLNKPYEK
jgi:hypothetical protein